MKNKKVKRMKKMTMNSIKNKMINITKKYKC